jgi:hypothetical protein
VRRCPSPGESPAEKRGPRIRDRALRARPARLRGFDPDLEIFEKIPADFRQNLRDE